MLQTKAQTAGKTAGVLDKCYKLRLRQLGKQLEF